MNGLRALLLLADRAMEREVPALLTRLGFDVLDICDNPRDATRRARERTPDVALVDIQASKAHDIIEMVVVLEEELGVAVLLVSAAAHGAGIEISDTVGPTLDVLPLAPGPELRQGVELVVRKHAIARERRRREHQAAMTLHSIAHGIIATDVLGRVVFMNRLAEEITGWSANAVAGQRIDGVVRLVTDAPRGDVDRAVDAPTHAGAVGARGVAVPRAEWGARSLDSAAPIAEEDGVVSGAVVILRDESGSAERAAADRLGSLRALAAGVVDQLEAPLRAAASGLARMTSLLGGRHHATPNELRLAVVDAARAERALQTAERIVRDLSFFSSSPNNRSGAAGSAREAIAMAIQEVELSVEIRQACPDLPEVSLDTERLAVVVKHLLMNASRAIQQAEPGSHAITISGAVHADAVEISVADTGAWIDPGMRERMFEPYSQMRSRSSDSSLELSVCYGLVASAGGAIRVDSKPSGGATFTVRLPRAPRAGQGGPRRARILAIDDDDTLQRLLARTLEDYELVVTDGVRALRLLRAGAQYDLILCDVVMPTVSGADIYEYLEEVDPDQATRVVFMTGGPSSPRELELLSTTPRRVLRKPYTMKTLSDVVAEELRLRGFQIS